MRISGDQVGLDGTVSTEAFNGASPYGAHVVEDRGVVGRADAADTLEVPDNVSLAAIANAVDAVQRLAIGSAGRPVRAPGPSASPEIALDFILREYPGLFREWDRNNDGRIDNAEYNNTTKRWFAIGYDVSTRVRPEHLVALDRAVVAIAPQAEAASSMVAGVRANPNYNLTLQSYLGR